MKKYQEITTVSVGKDGEIAARKILEAKGFQYITSNYRYGHYEIDLIMKESDFIVFIEVKSRSNESFGLPREFVNRKKQLRLIAAAEHYLSQNDLLDEPVRFDVVEVYLNSGEICHIRDAFQS